MKGLLDCPCCGFPIDPGIKWVAESIEREMRLELGKSYEMIVNSGARCEKHNTEVGGSKNSAHTLRLAVDIHFENSNELYLLLKHAYAFPVKRMGINFAKNFLHIDRAIGKVPHPSETLSEYPQQVVFRY